MKVETKGGGQRFSLTSETALVGVGDRKRLKIKAGEKAPGRGASWESAQLIETSYVQIHFPNGFVVDITLGWERRTFLLYRPIARSSLHTKYALKGEGEGERS